VLVSPKDNNQDSDERGADTGGPETGLAPAGLDMGDFLASMAGVLTRAAMQPAAVTTASVRFGASLAQIGPAAFSRWLGHQARPPLPADPKDRRFADSAWEQNPAFFALRQGYLAARQYGEELLAAGESDPVADGKAKMIGSLLGDALAPTNYLLTNPAALKRAFETGGASVLSGARNFADDLAHNGGRPQQVDRSAFTVGENLAVTEGQVVFRNELMELIQYAPQTKKVHAVPLLASPPWINKYYIMDLAPGRSFLEWAVQHKRTVFTISWRNPGPSMSDVSLEDYLNDGLRTALDVVADITGAEQADVVGLCLGGALAAMLAAHLAATGEKRIKSLTLLNTLLDYSKPGILGNFTDEQTVAQLERQMTETGVLDGAQMAATFDLLRANDLIFSYVVTNWLMGQSPPAFDILAWNADSTRLPAAMHSFYLRALYLRNELVRGELTLAGERLSLPDILSDTYVVGAVNDHIVPWEASYQATRLLGGEVRYVLSSGGHIAGIVNPPGPKARYEALTTGEHPPTPAEWRAAADTTAGSWWEDWAGWSARRAGPLASPPPMGSDRYPPLNDAPGTYVRE
jgi:polyhydroxyalkanoate synthase subunit PhaC